MQCFIEEKEVVTINEKLDCLDKKIEKQAMSIESQSTYLEKLSTSLNDLRVDMAKTLAMTDRLNKIEDNVDKTTLNVNLLSNRVVEHAETLKRLDKIEIDFSVHRTKDIEQIKELEFVITSMKEKEKSALNTNSEIGKIEQRLAKVERLLYYGVGAIGAIGSVTIMKIIFDITSYIYSHAGIVH